VPRRVTSPEFVGRGPELTALLDAVDSASDSRFCAVFVAGESGVGKSRLLHELEHEAETRGARVLAGECIALAEGGLPYAPIRSALRGLERDGDAQSSDELARLLPELGAAGSQARLFELLLTLLIRLAAEAPLVLMIEDVHWADRSTLDLLAFLLANARREPLLLVCSFRTDELDRRHPLRAFLAQHERPPAVQSIELHPFTPPELEAQLRGILGTAPDPELVERLHSRSEGNAFFTEELLAASRDGTQLPASLREALMLRIDALPETTQHVLRVAATHGRVVTHRLLAAASGLAEDALHDALLHAVSNHVLVRRDGATYAFRHALFAEALEFELLAGERMRLHLALAEAIQRDPTTVDRDGRAAAELCGHWLGAHRDPEALAAAVQAGIEAERVYAFAEASGHFRRALELWPRVGDAEQRAGMDAVALHLRAAEAAHLGGDEAAIPLVETAIDMVDPQADPYRAAVLRERLGHYVWMFLGDNDGAQRAYEAAVDLLPPDEPRPELARTLATLGQLLMLRGRTAESMVRCEQAIAIARQTGARREEALALNALGGNLGFRGERRAGIEHLRESLRIAGEAGDLDNVGRGYVNLSEMLEQDTQYEEAARLALEGARHTSELGMRDLHRLLVGEAATRLFKLGRLAEAAEQTHEALGLRPSLGRLDQCAARARVEIQRGRLAAAEPFLRGAEEAMPYAPATWLEPLASARVEFELLRGDPEEARRLAELPLQASDEHEYVAFTARLHALAARAGAMLAERARAAGDEAAADAAAVRARGMVDRIDGLLDPGRWQGTPPPEAVVHREACAAEAARAAGAAAPSDWAAVAERWAGLGLPLEEAYARLREAELHLLGADRALAEAAVAEGRRIAGACEAGWLNEQLDALARRGRLSPPEGSVVRDRAQDVSLTERELAVLELVAIGMTNREIGEQLFMATKTASVHVSRILSKLGVSSRVEAATAAQRLGLVP
jgi:DNA-binding CsgD family transcriptional regulator/tetratricopeptide (TPR) repeat protein